MPIYAINERGQVISVNEFFSKVVDFSTNPKLAKQTARYLKVLSRNSDFETLERITCPCNGNYSFEVSGYTIVFTITNDGICLLKLY